jgi:hypothetical protein
MNYINNHITSTYKPVSLSDVKSTTELTLKQVENKIVCNRYNRKTIAFQIIGDMIKLGYKRRVIIAQLVENLSVNTNYATILIQQYRKANGLVEARL